jgi:1-phosphatidylinositol-3-phosphate 5-kinase
VVVDPDTRNCTNSNSAALTNVGMPHGRKSEHDKLSQTAMVNIMFENTPVSPSSLPSNGEGHMFVGACQHKETEYSVDHKNSCEHCVSRATGSCNGYETSLCSSDNDSMTQNQNLQNSAKLTSNAHQYEFPAKECQQVDHWDRQPHDDQSVDQRDLNKFSGEYFPGSDNHQSILVSLSSTCIPKGLVCERSHLFRIKFYGSFDKPLGRYLRDDLFDEVHPIFILSMCCHVGLLIIYSFVNLMVNTFHIFIRHIAVSHAKSHQNHILGVILTSMVA